MSRDEQMTETGDPTLDLDPQSLAVLRRLEANPFLDPVNMTPAEMRAAFDAFYAPIDLPKADVEVRDTSFAGPGGPVPVRLYRPAGALAPLPVVMFYKGGGLIMGSLESYDAIARRLCASSGALVVSVAYRQPPEHRYPAACDDCYAALVWAHANAEALGGDPGRMAVAGDSGGGMLAAVVTHLAKDRGGPRLLFQTLIYPAIGRDGPSRSLELFASGYWFEPAALEWLYSQYVANPEEVADPGVSPVLRKDLHGLPPAYIVVAGCDILRDDIYRYAEKLKRAGVPTEVRTYARTIHGFVNMGGVIEYAGAALDACGERLASALA